MESVKEREDGWQGDPIIVLLIVGKGSERRVLIKTDQGKYDLPLAELKVVYASGEYSMPLFDPSQKLILIGRETEMHVSNGKERRLVEKVSLIALANNAA